MPVVRPWDAVRFAVRASRAGAPATRVMSLQYICERRHRPAEQGTLEFDAVSLVWLRRHADARVQKMAECFLESMIEKRGRAAQSLRETA
jgi:hypothetical protein